LLYILLDRWNGVLVKSAGAAEPIHWFSDFYHLPFFHIANSPASMAFWEIWQWHPIGGTARVSTQAILTGFPVLCGNSRGETYAGARGATFTSTAIRRQRKEILPAVFDFRGPQ
jgi:hypothetical protein